MASTDPRCGESERRIARLRAAMDRKDPAWGTVFLLGRVNQYYFAGSMQDGLLVVRRDGPAVYFVRRSYDRAAEESDLTDVRPMESYREAAAAIGAECGRTYLETEVATVAVVERLRRAFSFGEALSVDRTVLEVRMVKSAYEIGRMEEAGRRHRRFYDEAIPRMLEEGMSELELYGRVFDGMLRFGSHGVSRFSMFQNEAIVGQIAFGESTLVRQSFDGPGGGLGLSAAVPLLGSPSRRLATGDLVFVDAGFGIDGYHTDCTQVYRFDAEPSEEMARLHALCVAVEEEAAERLRPGTKPSELYERALARVGPELEPHFMGIGGKRVKFLGHGIGLHLDELPVLARGFDQPLEEGVCIALEPKIGIPGVGMVGVEDTYVVTPEGGRCLTGGPEPIRVVPRRNPG